MNAMARLVCLCCIYHMMGVLTVSKFNVVIQDSATEVCNRKPVGVTSIPTFLLKAKQHIFRTINYIKDLDFYM